MWGFDQFQTFPCSTLNWINHINFLNDLCFNYIYAAQSPLKKIIYVYADMYTIYGISNYVYLFNKFHTQLYSIIFESKYKGKDQWNKSFKLLNYSPFCI